MKPIQLWLPTFWGGIARPELRADMQRLFRARTSEKVMWTVPGWSGPASWTEKGIAVGCINGQTTECVRILHVGENGIVVGRGAAAFPMQSVAGLLDAWLNDEFVRAVLVKPGRPLHVEIPHPVKGGVAYIKKELPVHEAHHFPVTRLADDTHATAQWPPSSDMPTTVSPELESVRSLLDIPTKSLPLRLAWLAPFHDLQPMLITPDDLMARDRMRLVAQASHHENANALARAITEAREWVSDGQATVNEAWLQPIIANEGEEGALFAIDARYGISAGSLKHAYEDHELQERLGERIPVTRAWGVAGLMWALLLDRLSSAQPCRSCERCGRLISGRGHKRFCSVSDNPVCFRARKAVEKRRNRPKGSTRSSRR